MNKQQISGLLRNIRVLPLAEKLLFLKDVIKHHSTNKRMVRENPDFTFPPYWLVYDVTGSVKYEPYKRLGYRVAEQIYNLYDPLFSDKNRLAICEWGCGPARVIRHIPQVAVLSERTATCGM